MANSLNMMLLLRGKPQLVITLLGVKISALQAVTSAPSLTKISLQADTIRLPLDDFLSAYLLPHREKGPTMTMKTNAAALSLAGSLATALSLLSAPAASAGPDTKTTMDKCYGISLKSQNDCAAGAGTSCAGTSKVDYDPAAWKYVAKGTCDTIKTPKGMGSLTPKS